MEQRPHRSTAVVDADDPRLAQFHAGIYTAAFAHQAEPLSAWQRALRGTAPYSLHIALVDDIAGICFEHYPRSNVGLVTYLVVASHARTRGLGHQLLHAASADLRARGAALVLAEVNDPRRTGEWSRLARFQRWGARVIDGTYVQPALGPDLARDRGLLLLAFGERTTSVDGVRVRSFIAELYAATEGGDPDPACAFSDEARLVELPVPTGT